MKEFVRCYGGFERGSVGLGEVVEGDVAAAEGGFEAVLGNGEVEDVDDGDRREKFDGSSRAKDHGWR